MCGICGILNFSDQKVTKQDISTMCAALVHRGPDSSGMHIKNNLGLGHRRLSIIDLETGDQPIYNETKTICLVFNGEIYNFKILRRHLEAKGHTFFTQSDSEVIVHLYEEYREDCLKYLRGMFAFALWDQSTKKLFLARDRVGKKPLFWYRDNERFVFASELAALLSLPFIRRSVDHQALNLYLSFLYVPAPRTMFENINKLLPAHYIILEDNTVKVKRYWQLDFKTSTRKSLNDYKEGLIEKFNDSVKLRLTSDVPLGVFLSGGLDSSAVVAFMKKNSGETFKTFSVGFENKLYNELSFARAIADKFKTDHYELVVKPNAIEVLPKLIRHYGEPFADYSCIPTYYLAEFASKHVKAVLTGDGGDESFAGYYRFTATKVAQTFDLLPGFMGRLISQAISSMPAGNDIRNNTWQIKRFFKYLNNPELTRYLNWIACFDAQEKQELYNEEFQNSINPDADLHFLEHLYKDKKGSNFSDVSMQVGIESYLPYDLLVKMDIATMANSLEARSPFLDHEFMEYAACIPFDLKLHNLKNKFILKQALKPFLPAAIINRKKQGFGIPVGEWLRHELKDYMIAVVLDRGLALKRYFNKGFLERIINDHLKQRTDNGYKIWTLMMFGLWHKEFIEK